MARAVTAPDLRIEPIGDAEREGDAWRTSWRVINNDPLAIRCVSAVAPHAKFRSADTRLDFDVRGGGVGTLTLLIHADGSPRSEIENAFVILRIERGEEQWRLLVRVRVPIDENGRPRPRVETMTTQRVGFTNEP